MRSSIYHSREDQAFGCHGCFDRVEIPGWAANDPQNFAEMREYLEQQHRDRGCVDAMEKLEAMAYKGNRLQLVKG